MKALIVDDEAIAIEFALESVQWEELNIDEVFTASSAEQAKLILQEYSVDVLICDIEMPDQNGLELIEWMNEKELVIVSILLTGYSYFTYAQHAIKLGVSCYLIKPIKAQILQEEIKNTIERFHAHTAKSLPDDLGINDQDVFEKAKEYIYSHLSGSIKRDEISKHVALSPDHLLRVFKKRTGMTISEYINDARIMMAKQYLETTHLYVSEIAELVGFTNYSYFTKVFKKAIGITPNELRGR